MSVKKKWVLISEKELDSIVRDYRNTNRVSPAANIVKGIMKRQNKMNISTLQSIFGDNLNNILENLKDAYEDGKIDWKDTPELYSIVMDVIKMANKGSKIKKEFKDLSNLEVATLLANIVYSVEIAYNETKLLISKKRSPKK